MKFSLNVCGFPTEAEYTDACVETLLLPFLRMLSGEYEKAGVRRLIVFLAAPPGAGKSTLAAALELLSRGPGLVPLQQAGLDGFHYPQRWLETHSLTENGRTLPMSARKGCPDTFDAEGARALLEAARERDVRFPVYSRVTHEPEADALPVTAPILLLEGNWLLLDEPRWRRLRDLCDLTVSVSAPESLLRPRLIARKIRGGLSPEAAEAFYLNSDGPNVRLYAERSVPARLAWRLDAEGRLTGSPGTGSETR